MQDKKNKLYAKRYTRNATQQRGSIVVLGLLIATGIIVISAELALYVASSMRQARTIDSSTLAYFNAESGVENALYRIRKDITFSGTLSEIEKSLDQGKWSFYCDASSVVTANNCKSSNPGEVFDRTKIDEQKFSDKTDRLEKSFFEHDSF